MARTFGLWQAPVTYFARLAAWSARGRVGDGQRALDLQLVCEALAPSTNWRAVVSVSVWISLAVGRCCRLHFLIVEQSRPFEERRRVPLAVMPTAVRLHTTQPQSDLQTFSGSRRLWFRARQQLRCPGHEAPPHNAQHHCARKA